MFCKEFGWDYFTYERQPSWFIDELTLIMNQVAQKEKHDADRAKAKNRLRSPHRT